MMGNAEGNGDGENGATGFESPDSPGNPTDFLQPDFVSVSQPHTRRKAWECFAMGQGKEGHYQ